MAGRKKARQTSEESDSSSKGGRKARSKFESIEKEELEAFTAPPEAVEKPLSLVPSDETPSAQDVAPAAVSSSSCTPQAFELNPTVTGVEPEKAIVEAPMVARQEFLPLAAVVATEENREENAVHRTLREPNPPVEIIMVTTPGAVVPSLPMDLMELLAA